MKPEEFAIAVSAFCFLLDGSPVARNAASDRASWFESFNSFGHARPLRAYVTYRVALPADMRQAMAERFGLVWHADGKGDVLTAPGELQV